MKKKVTLNLTLSAMFIAVGILLPFVTGQIPNIGRSLLPMHIPVMLCGLICSWQYGTAVGAILPLLRSLLLGTPAIYPDAVVMAFELCTYGLTIGLIYSMFKKKNIITVYVSLVCAMIAGRIVWGAVKLTLLGATAFPMKAFIAGGFVNAFPGIVLQLVLIPAIVVLVDKFKKP